MKTITTAIVFLAFSLVSFATDTIQSIDTLGITIDTLATDTVQAVAPVVSTGDSMQLSWALLASLVLGIYEVVVRIFPTVSNISVLSFVMKLINLLVPNFKKSGGKHL